MGQVWVTQSGIIVRWLSVGGGGAAAARGGSSVRQRTQGLRIARM